MTLKSTETKIVILHRREKTGDVEQAHARAYVLPPRVFCGMMRGFLTNRRGQTPWCIILSYPNDEDD